MMVTINSGSLDCDVVADEKVQTFTGTNKNPDKITYKFKGQVVAVITNTVAANDQVTHSVRTSS